MVLVSYQLYWFQPIFSIFTTDGESGRVRVSTSHLSTNVESRYKLNKPNNIFLCKNIKNIKNKYKRSKSNFGK